MYQANETGVRHELSEEPRWWLHAFPCAVAAEVETEVDRMPGCVLCASPQASRTSRMDPRPREFSAGLGRLGAAGAWSGPLRTGSDLVLHTVVLAYRPIERAGGVLHLRG